MTLIACPHPTGYFYKRDDSKRLVKIPKGCGRWDCPYCGPIKKKRLLDRIAAYFSGHPNECRMLTLTLRSDLDDTKITMYWNRLKASLRKYGYKFAYAWFKQFTEKGTRHLHVLLDKYVPRKLIKRLWLKATDYTSYLVKINHRPIRSAAGYVSRYVTRDIQGEARYLPKEHRYQCSRDFNLPKVASSHEWGFEYDPDYQLRHDGPEDKMPSSRIAKLREKWNEMQASKHRPPESKQ